MGTSDSDQGTGTLFQIGPFEVIVAALNFIVFCVFIIVLVLVGRWLFIQRPRQAAAMRSLEERIKRVEAQLSEGDRSRDVPQP